MKLVFIGTAEFAVPVLESIVKKTDWKIVLVISEPARPAGRDMVSTKSPVVLAAKKLGLDVFTPDSISNPASVDKIMAVIPDINIVVAYGQLLTREIFDFPKFKSVNIHPSLLPKLRGPSPIQSTLLSGQKETGVSLMILDKKIDHGPIIAQEKVAIGADDDYLSLENKLAKVGAEMIVKNIPLYVSGKIKPKEQNDSEATFTKIIKKENGWVDWSKSADEIYNQYRAFKKWPGIFTFFKNKSGQTVRLKLIEIAIWQTSEVCHRIAGEVFIDNSKKLYITCSVGAIEIKKLQPENSKVLSSSEFLNGYRYVLGQKLF